MTGRQAHLHREADRRNAGRGRSSSPGSPSDAGVTAGVVHDKLYLPGLVKLRRLVDEGFFGRILSLRGEFGYWVFEGDGQPAQRPSWNYRKEDGGGMTIDMFCHWNYVLEGIIGQVKSVTAKTRRPTSRPAGTSRARPYDGDRRRRRVRHLRARDPGGDPVIAQINSSWAVRVYRDELVEFQIDGTHGSAVAGLNKCVAQQRAHTPKPVWNPDLPVTESFRDQWLEVPANADLDNGFKAAVGGVPARRRGRAASTASACCPPPAACSSPSSACSPPPSAAPSTSRRSRCDRTFTDPLRLPSDGGTAVPLRAR